jgi:DNA-binding transcriptional MerR regulator
MRPMLADPETFDLNELAAAAGVTPRTIRYYVQQGLLPSPELRGPGTRYERAHLDRLHLIRRLQRQHLPLAEIRRRLERLDDDGVREALRATLEEPPHSSALEYVRGVLSKQSERPARPPPSSAPPASALLDLSSVTPFAASAAAAPDLAAAPVPSSAPARRAARSTWERLTLAPDIELHVRRPLSREQNRLVDRLVETARQFFAEEP